MPIHDPIFNDMSYLLEATDATGFEDEEYKSLNDAARYEPSLAPGKTEVWFMKPDVFTRFIIGTEVPTIKSLKRTHVLLGKVKETNPDKLYKALQGERWSPKGEASQLILSLNLRHTSMSVGDVLKIGGKYYACAPSGMLHNKGNGWTELNEDQTIVGEAQLESGSKAKVLKTMKVKDLDSGEHEVVYAGDVVTVSYKDGNGYVVGAPGMNSVKLSANALKPL